MATDAIVASVGVSFTFAIVIAFLFCLLRPHNSTVYAPRLRFADEKHAPPPLGNGPFAWCGIVFKYKEQEMFEKNGLDATLFIRFVHMCRDILLCLSVVGCGILIPVNVVSGNLQTFHGGVRGVAPLLKMTPQFMSGQIFWAMVACAWTIDIVVVFFLWRNYRAVTRLRRQYFASSEYQNSLHSRTLMVTGIPKAMRTDEGVVRIVDAVKNMQEIPKGVIARNVKDLPELIEEHDELVRLLEYHLAKFLKRGAIPDKRPDRPMSKKDPAYVKGKRVDAIDYLTERIKELETKVKQVRETVDKRNALSYGFASYESIEEAHSVAYAAQKSHPHGATVRLATRPSDIIWKNIPLSKLARRKRAVMNNIFIFLLTLIWTVPNVLIAVFLQNLSNLGRVWPAFNRQLQMYPKAWSIVQGVLAPAILSMFYIFLPVVFRRLRIRVGDISKTARERHVFAKLYSFFTLNNMILFSLYSTIWQFFATLSAARSSGSTIADAFHRTDIWSHSMIAFCYVSPFWISWLLQRNLGAAIDLSQLVNFVWGTVVRKCFTPSPREIIELTAPPPFDYATYYNYFLFYVTVALCFATLQPLVLPVAALYFVLDGYLKKYLIIYVFYTKHESGGLFWRPVFNRFLFATFLSNVIIALLIRAKGIVWQPMLAAMIPLPIMLLAFKIYCARTYDDQMYFYTKGVMQPDVGLDDTKSRRTTNIGTRFGHPALYQQLMTPMVHKKSAHLLPQVYKGRLDGSDDTASLAGFSDVYSLSNMAPSRKAASKDGSGQFELVAESEMDFENFKNRPDFAAEHGGEGDMYGKPEDLIRAGTPAGSRSQSRDSDRTLLGHGQSPAGTGPFFAKSSSSSNLPGTVYPAGYHPTPTSALRGTSPSPDRAGGWNASSRDLVAAAAPMGRSASYHDDPDPTTEARTTTTTTSAYDPLRGRGR